MRHDVVVLRNIFQGEAPGEFWIDGVDVPLAGTIKLRVGRLPELTLIGRLPGRGNGLISFSTPKPHQDVMRGRILLPETGHSREIVLIRARCNSTSTSLGGSPNVSWWVAQMAVVAPQLGGDEMVNGLDVGLAGFSEANSPPRATIIADVDELKFRSETLGAVSGMSLSSALLTSKERSAGKEHVNWERVLRVELEASIPMSSALEHAVAVLSGYSVLSGRYAPIYGLSFHGNKPDPDSSSGWMGDVYGSFGLEWQKADALNTRGKKISEPADSEFLVTWLDFFFRRRVIARNMFEALHFWHLATSGKPADWAGLLVRLGVLSEAFFGLQSDAPTLPGDKSFRKVRKFIERQVSDAIERGDLETPFGKEDFLAHFRESWAVASKDTLAQKLQGLVQQLEAYLGQALVGEGEIKLWKEMRHNSAHLGDQEDKLAGAPSMIQRWSAVLNAWLLMHLGASMNSVRASLGAVGMLQDELEEPNLSPGS